VTEERRRAAIVTGASRGIGAQIAALMLAEGWDLTVSARSPDPLAATVAALAATALGAAVEAVPADMADPEQVTALRTNHEQRFGRLDAIVLNAGMGSIGSFAEFPLRRLDRLLAVNVRSAYQLIQESLPLLRATAVSAPGGARVIAISSMTGIVGEPLNSAYGATKAALTSLCDTLSAEESVNGVSGTAICPGYVATDMTVGLHDKVAAADMITTRDVAEMAVAVTRLSRHAVVRLVPLTRPGPSSWQA